MISFEIYERIQFYKKEKFNKNQTANRLGISPHTVKSYWDITPEEYRQRREKITKRKRKSKCSQYREEIIELLKDYKEFSSAQIYDRLEEAHGGDLGVKEGTVRNYVRRVRKEEGLENKEEKRDYQAVEDPPPGYQAQVDYGEIQVRRADNKNKRQKVYVFSMVLSYSRYKFSVWQNHPFSAQESVEAHQQAFDYFGGIPRTIVYDQDARIVVSENYGEIIYTEVFQAYLNQMPFKPVICRKADPESKGKIENVIGYHKNNFARGRLYTTIEEWNEQNRKWLERRANGKVHQGIKEVPAERFEKEKPFLQPTQTVKILEPIVKHKLNKDNTLTFRSNRYDVPCGSYNACPEVGVRVHGDRLLIYDGKSGALLADHKLASEKGQLVQLRPRVKEMSQSARKKSREVFELLGANEEAKELVETIIERFPRYVKEQMEQIANSASVWSNQPGLIRQAAAFCIKHDLFSASGFKTALEHLAACKEMENAPVEMTPGQRERMKAVMQTKGPGPDSRESREERMRQLKEIQKGQTEHERE